MTCPDCRLPLVEIPTAELPQIDVCPAGHGLWLDAREMSLFVENYGRLEEDLQTAVGGTVASRAQVCPRCRQPLANARLAAAALLTCPEGHGFWLPRGSLTRLNESYRGRGVTIRLREEAFYARASARAARPTRAPSRAVGSAAVRQTRRLLLWALLLGAGLWLSGLTLFRGVMQEWEAGQWVRPPDGLFFWLVIGLAGGVGLFIYGFVLHRRKSLIECIPTSTVRSLAVGLVEVAGTAEPNDAPLQSPFSDLPCVLYSYKVEEWRRSGKRHQWVTIRKGVSDAPFFLRDRTGAVFVDPTEAELIVSEDRTYDNRWGKSFPPTVQKGLAGLGLAVDGSWSDRTLRCTEAFIQPRDTVYVLGAAQEDLNATGASANEDRLYIGYHPDEAFMISDRSEKDLLEELNWQVRALLWGGPLLTLVCLLVIVTRYLRLTP